MPEGKTSDQAQGPADLRRLAEELYAARLATPELSPSETSALVRELCVRQIELELQNEELRLARADLEAALAQDLVAGKRAAGALRESEERYRSLFESNHAVMLLIDPESGAIVDANPAASAWYGWDRSELLAMRVDEINTLTPAEVLADMKSARAEKEGLFNFRHRRADGSIRDVDVYSGPLELRGRTLLYSLVFDVTERELAAEELAHYRVRLEQLVAERTEELSAANRVLAERGEDAARWRQNFDAFFNTIDDLLFVLDAEGTMIHVNQTVCRRLGYAEEELVGRPVLDVHPAGRREEAGRIVAAMLGGEADFCPVPVVTSSGAEIPVETRVVPGVWDGEPALFGVTKDVSALKRSEEKFSRAFHSAPALMAISTLDDGRFIDVNEMFLAALGLSREGVVGHTSGELGLFADQGKRRDIAQAAGQTSVRNVEIEARRRDGTVLRGLLSADPIMLGDEPCLLTTMLDLTERKQAEEALAESEALYRSVMNAFPDAVTVTDLEGRVQMVSPAAMELLGYEDEKVGIGRLLTDFLAPEDRERGQTSIARMHERVQRESNEYLGLRADGSTFPIEVSSDFIRDADQRPSGMVFIVRDITERKLAEARLRESEELLACAVEGSGVGLWDWYPQTGEETFNERWAEIAGYTLAELAPTSIETWRELTHPDDLQRADELLEEHFAGKSAIYSIEERVRHKDGHWIWVLDRGKVSEWDDEGRPVRMTGTALDITERKESEDALRQASDRLALATSAGGVGVWEYDVVRDRLLWDDQMFRLYGISRDQFSGAFEAWQAGVHPDDRERGSAEIQMAVSGEKEFDTEFRVLFPDGTVRHLRALARAERDGSGRATRMIGTNWDITESRLAEDALQQSEALYRSIMSASPENITITDLEGRIRLTSSAALGMFGYESVGEAQGRLLTDLLVPEDRERAGGDVALMHQGAAPAASEYRGLRADGSTFDIELSGEVIRDAHGQPTGMVFISRDITVRNEAEERLRESEEQLARAVEGSGAGLWDWNIPAREVTFNERWAEIAGYTLAELSPVSVDDWNDMWDPDDLRRSDELIERHFAGESSMYECEVRVRHKDGHWVWVLDRGKVSEWDGDGRPVRMVGTQLDITKRKEAEEKLRLRESSLSAIIENQPGLVWLKDTEGRFLAANSAFAAIAGRPGADDIVGRTDLDIWPRDRAEKYLSDDVATMKARRPTIYQQEIDVGGVTRWFETFKAAVVDDEGTVLGTTGYAADVTERRLADERLRGANRQLEQAVAHANDLAMEAQSATIAKTRFLAHMSHEIRTPLNAIIGFAQLLRQDPELTAQQADRVKIINRSGEHLLALLSDILELSKVEAKVQRLERVPFDLRDLLDDLALVFGVRAEAKGLTFRMDAPDETPHFVTGDQVKLRQTLTNLLANAVKFTDEGGVAMRVSTSQAAEAGGYRLVVLVEDSGVGIAADEMGALFAPFEQTTSGLDSGSGTGLGLAISRQFAKVMGGELSVTSKVGEGTIFRLEVPLEAGTAGMTARSDARRVVRLEAGQPPFLALVVDDDEDGRTLLCEMLGDVGFDVVAAGGGLEAVEAFGDRCPSIVLMDLWMPDVDGNEATRRIRAGEGGEAAKIIALTANFTDGVRSGALAAGADAFMAKPFRASALFEQIRLLTGVRYQYAEEAEAVAAVVAPPALDRTKLDALPEDLKQQIRDAAVRARHARLLELAAEVAAVEPETGAALEKIIGTFDYSPVLLALEEGAT